MNNQSVQEQFAPQGICFGCGVANEKGLRIRSFESDGVLVCDWNPAEHHQAFPGMLNGGIIGALLDCHCNWAATMHLMKKTGQQAPPCTVTADYLIKLRRPTPVDTTIHLRAWVVESSDDRAVVEGELIADGKVCATCKGTFVAVKEGHPAYHRW
jgi:acyl-coenzyme A thioesterase PaaI-like protein